MAERRMFAKTIIDSDAFLEMPVAAQCLYFHLAMRADDDGFMNGPKKVMRILGSKDADIQILIDKKFIIPFQSGIIVIKHWRIHNYIRQDTYKATPYNSEKSTLYYDENMGYTQNQTERKVDEPTPKRQLAVNGSATKRKRTVNGTSTKRQPTVNEPSTERQQNVDEPLTQDRIGKDSLGKNNLEKENKEKETRKGYGIYSNVFLTDKEFETLSLEFPLDFQSRIDDCSCYCKQFGRRYKDYLAAIRNWARRDLKNRSPVKPSATEALLKFEVKP